MSFICFLPGSCGTTASLLVDDTTKTPYILDMEKKYFKETIELSWLAPFWYASLKSTHWDKIKLSEDEKIILASLLEVLEAKVGNLKVNHCIKK